jgi:MSHA biogenesis protein MshI
MSNSSFFSKFNFSKQVQSRLSIVILSDGIYAATSNVSNQFEQSFFVPISDPSHWMNSLVSLIHKNGLESRQANIVLGSHLYQAFQIDTPDIPRSEYQGALPFLVKDLVTERLGDIVADGFPLSPLGKLQTYVTKRQVIESVSKICHENDISLQRIVPEDMAWGVVNKESESYMLLYRDIKSDFKLSAYKESNICFNRSLRGVTPPLTGANLNSLQLDALALELQRSLDYLTSQLQSVAINNLYFMCDGEDPLQLTEELQARLGVSVKQLPLAEDALKSCGDTLAWSGLQLSDDGVNLYPEHLKPTFDHFTFKNVVIGWVIIGIVMAIVSSVILFNHSEESNKLTHLTTESQKQMLELDQLNNKLASHKPSASKIAAVERLKKDIKAKEASFRAIDQLDNSSQIGFSGVMKSLTTIGKNDISLSKIYIQGESMSFSGLARNATVVPKWIQAFKSEMHLVGRTFGKLSIFHDENGHVTFTLTTNDGGEK